MASKSQCLRVRKAFRRVKSQKWWYTGYHEIPWHRTHLPHRIFKIYFYYFQRALGIFYLSAVLYESVVNTMFKPMIQVRKLRHRGVQ